METDSGLFRGPNSPGAPARNGCSLRLPRSQIYVSAPQEPTNAEPGGSRGQERAPVTLITTFPAGFCCVSANPSAFGPLCRMASAANSSAAWRCVQCGGPHPAQDL